MQRIRISLGITLGFILILSTGLIQSQGPAVVTKDPDAVCFTVWIDVSGNSFPALPGGEGLVLVSMENVIAVETNSRNGNLNLSCHGQIPFGEQVAAIDFITGDPVLATMATREEACNGISQVFPEACRGNGSVVFNFDVTGGGVCTIDGIPTENWVAVQSPRGRAVLSCHVTQ